MPSYDENEVVPVGITERIMTATDHLKLVSIRWVNTGGLVRWWEAARRVMKNKKINEKSFDEIAVVVPVTDEGKIVYISQFRATVGAVRAKKNELVNESEYQVIEFPAGVVDDEKNNVFTTAQQELREEAGFVARNWKILNKGMISAGATFEFTTEFLATLLERVPRGETEEEKGITVYEIPVSEALKWLMKKENEGYILDAKVLPLTVLAQAVLLDANIKR